jgi:3-oxoacyl-[acyl-carrier protein] reductase
MIALEGRRVLVTGGSRGIGAACCRLFAEAGAAVCVHYHHREDAAVAVLASLQASSRQEHFMVSANLAVPQGVDRVFESLEKSWGGLDCLVNNAGIWIRNPIKELDLELLEETWALNERAVFLCTSRAIPFLEQSDDGNVVNISSTAGQRGEAQFSPYAASKGAMIAATKSWSSELAPKVRVNSVAPGWVDTELSAEAFIDGGLETIARSIPLQRVASAEDIAGPVVFLASPLARHVTGEILNVNGGSVLAG